MFTCVAYCQLSVAYCQLPSAVPYVGTAPNIPNTLNICLNLGHRLVTNQVWNRVQENNRPHFCMELRPASILCFPR